MFLIYNYKMLMHFVLTRLALTGSLQAFGYMTDARPLWANSITWRFDVICLGGTVARRPAGETVDGP
jgi:hypothetical protein